MTDLERLILDELRRHEQVIGPYFNLRCKCGHVEAVVSEPGDFERHVSTALATALGAAGLATADKVLDEAAVAAGDPTPEDMDRYFIDQSDAAGWLHARAAAARTRATPLRPADMPEDERHASWCRGDHDGPCRRGRQTGTEKQVAP